MLKPFYMASLTEVNYIGIQKYSVLAYWVPDICKHGFSLEMKVWLADGQNLRLVRDLISAALLSNTGPSVFNLIMCFAFVIRLLI